MRGPAIFYLLVVCSLVQALPLKSKPKNPDADADDEYYDDEEDAQLPQTSFTCIDKLDGFYADIEADCRVFHYCQTVRNHDGDDEKLDRAFFCPPTTIFRQEYLTCTSPSKSFNCSDSEKYYNANENKPTELPTTTTTSAVPDEGTAADDDLSTSTSSSTTPATTTTSTTSTTTTSSSTPANPSTPNSTQQGSDPSLGIHEYPFVTNTHPTTFFPQIKPSWLNYRSGMPRVFQLPEWRINPLSLIGISPW